MNTNKYLKSPDVIVLKKNNDLFLVHQTSRKTLSLNFQQAYYWTEWGSNISENNVLDSLKDSLLFGQFILKRELENVSITPISFLDFIVPVLEENSVKWYEESPDMFVLFNTQSMMVNNPLLVLGPYGSLCWRGIISGKTIAEIRSEALRIFGSDEVIHFIRRLINLGFIRRIHEIERVQLHSEKIRKEFIAPEIQFQLDHSVIPWYCLWEINTMCNLRCKMCYLPHFKSIGPNNEGSLKIIQEIIDTRIFYVALLGGEPLLRNDIERIIEHLRASGIFVKIISNGICLNIARANALKNANLNQIEISFDGLCSSTHENSRGRNTFEKALSAVRNAQEANIPRVGIVWTVHNGNVGELTKLPQFMNDLGVHECYVSLFKKTGKFGSVSSYNPINADSLQTIHNYLRIWSNEFPELSIALLPGCSCGRTSIVIGNDGDVRLCSFSFQSIGNIYKTSLLDIWHNGNTALPTEKPLGYCSIGNNLHRSLSQTIN